MFDRTCFVGSAYVRNQKVVAGREPFHNDELSIRAAAEAIGNLGKKGLLTWLIGAMLKSGVIRLSHPTNGFLKHVHHLYLLVLPTQTYDCVQIGASFSGRRTFNATAPFSRVSNGVQAWLHLVKFT